MKKGLTCLSKAVVELVDLVHLPHSIYKHIPLGGLISPPLQPFDDR